MPFQAGDTFFFATTSDPHLWVVLTDPEVFPRQVLIVNFTTWDPADSLRRFQDPACILAAGDHPWINHPTCVVYQETRLITLHHLEVLQANGCLAPHARMNPKVLQKMRNLAGDSHEMRPDYYQILEDHGLIEYDD